MRQQKRKMYKKEKTVIQAKIANHSQRSYELPRFLVQWVHSVGINLFVETTVIF